MVGTGLIGGSVGLALRRAGWHVTGRDRDPARAERAVAIGAADAAGSDPDAAITFVATPLAQVGAEVRAAVEQSGGIVTDVAGVKAPLRPLMRSHPAYVGGHPMAGSELEGVDGARADLFEGRTWVLTPLPETDDRALATVTTVVTSFGAQVVAMPPEEHDAMVAVVSHVPHLTAATLMRLANERSVEHRALLRLAAGGFRDMTRVAAGHPGIWPDICAENREAIVGELDRLVAALTEVRTLVAGSDRVRLTALLEEARNARLSLPAPVARSAQLSEIRVPVPDRPGVLADVTTLATQLDVNVLDIEIAHSIEGDEGVLILMVANDDAVRLTGRLQQEGYRPQSRQIDGPIA